MQVLAQRRQEDEAEEDQSGDEQRVHGPHVGVCMVQSASKKAGCACRVTAHNIHKQVI